MDPDKLWLYRFLQNHTVLGSLSPHVLEAYRQDWATSAQHRSNKQDTHRMHIRVVLHRKCTRARVAGYPSPTGYVGGVIPTYLGRPRRF